MGGRNQAAAYSQGRRDQEVATRRALEDMVPDEHFDASVQGGPGTKVLTAAASYIQALEAEVAAAAPEEERPEQVDASAQTTTNREPFRADAPAWFLENVELEFLKQAMMRLTHVLQERAAAEGEVSEELKKQMNEAHDNLVDAINKVQGKTE